VNGDATKRAACLLESVIRELKSKRKITGFGGVFIEDIRCWESWLREAHGLISHQQSEPVWKCVGCGAITQAEGVSCDCQVPALAKWINGVATFPAS